MELSKVIAASPTLIVAALILLSLPFPRYRGLALGLLAIAIAAQPLKELFSALGVDSRRPCCADELGMPSGHTMFATFLAIVGPSVLGVDARSVCAWRSALTLYAGVVAGQRIASGKHSLEQVLVGLAIGAGAGYGIGVRPRRRS